MIAGLPEVATNAFYTIDVEAFSVFRSPSADGPASRGAQPDTSEVSIRNGISGCD
jgi:hypothetical protein